MKLTKRESFDLLQLLRHAGYLPDDIYGDTEFQCALSSIHDKLIADVHSKNT